MCIRDRPDDRIETWVPGRRAVKHVGSQDALLQEVAFPAESGFDEMPQESGWPLGGGKRRARDHRVECREHRVRRDFAGGVRFRLLVEVWLAGVFGQRPLRRTFRICTFSPLCNSYRYQGLSHALLR